MGLGLGFRIASLALAMYVFHIRSQSNAQLLHMLQQTCVAQKIMCRMNASSHICVVMCDIQKGEGKVPLCEHIHRILTLVGHPHGTAGRRSCTLAAANKMVCLPH